jgi:sugar phosphate permease
VSAPNRDEAPAPTLAYRSWVLTVLVIVYAFNFIDRQIVGILAIPIKADLKLSDAQLGMMGGLAFALFYTLLGIPIARLADRVSRIRIMSVALAVWSLMTAVCGTTMSFGQLFLARLGVGVGEAGGVAPAYSVICDYFPPKERARALSVYSFGIPIGSAVGIVAGAFLTRFASWRLAFIVVGIAGVVLTPLLALGVREPPRGGFDSPASDAQVPTPAAPDRSAQPPTLWQVCLTLVRKRSFWGLSVGASFSSMMGYGLFFWLPSLLHRSLGLSLVEAALAFGSLLLVGGLTGIWLGGFAADRYGQRHRSRYALYPAIAFIATVPFYFVGVLSTNVWMFMAVSIVPTALGLAWLGPVLAAVQQLVPANMRATASALFLFINNLIGIGLGSYLLGLLSDALRVLFGAESLRYAILAGTVFYFVAAALFLYASRHLDAEWQD